MRIAIRHEMSFTPPPGTGHVVAQLLLTPQSGPTQKVAGWSVEMAGIRNAGRFVDAYGNIAHLVNQSRPEGILTIVVNGVVETLDKHGVLGRLAGGPVPALYRRETALAKAPGLISSRFRSGKETRIDLLHALMARVGEVMGSVEEPAAHTQTQMQADGVQSQGQSGARPLPPASEPAHAFIGVARSLGIPARYVTGYLMDVPEGVSAFHAWAEAYDEGLGWIGFDPLLGLCPTDRHVRLAVGLDADSARSVRVVPAGNGVATVSVSVTAE